MESGGSFCKDPACGWEGNDPAVQKCPRCGSWCCFWLTDLVGLDDEDQDDQAGGDGSGRDGLAGLM